MQTQGDNKGRSEREPNTSEADQLQRTTGKKKKRKEKKEPERILLLPLMVRLSSSFSWSSPITRLLMRIAHASCVEAVANALSDSVSFTRKQLLSADEPQHN